MKATVFYGKESIKLENVERPELPQGGAIFKVIVASICGTDFRSYRFGNEKLTNRIIGHEGCFYIDQIDSSVKDFKVGDRVIMAPALGCGQCTSCKKGRTNMCDNLFTIGFESQGTFAEYVPIPKRAFDMNQVIKVPDSLSDLEASVVEPTACALNAQNLLSISEGENVLIYGAGFLGCIHAELAKQKGAKHVVLSDISHKRVEQAKKDLQGVTVLNSGDPDFVELIKEATNGEGVDIVITAAPAGITHKQGLEIINKCGRMSLFGGLAGDGTGFLSSNLIHYKEVGVFGAHASTAEQNKEVAKMFAEGKVDVKKYITVYPLEEVDKAFQELAKEDTIKALLRP